MHWGFNFKFACKIYFEQGEESELRDRQWFFFLKSARIGILCVTNLFFILNKIFFD